MLMLQRLGDPEKFEIRNQQEILDTVSQTTATFTFLFGRCGQHCAFGWRNWHYEHHVGVSD